MDPKSVRIGSENIGQKYSDKPTNSAGPKYTIQAASVKAAKDADRMVAKLKKRGYPAYRVIGKVPGSGIWFRIRVGKFTSRSEARPMLDKLKKDGHKPILVLSTKQ